jgi:hypothetical protein
VRLLEASRLLLLVLAGACSFEVRPSQSPADAAPSDGDVGDAPPDVSTPDASDAGPRTDWWDPMYPVRFPILITTSTALPSGYQVAVVTDLDAAPCMATGERASVRIARADSTADLPRVIEAAGGMDERIWFKLPAAQAASGPSGYYLYCGASAPTMPQSSPSLVLDYHDGFEGNALAAGWLIGGIGMSGATMVTNGEVSIPAGRSIYRSLPIGPAHILEFQMRKAATSGQYWGGWQNGTGYTAPWMVWIARQPNAIHPELFGNGDAGYSVGSDVSINTAVHAYSIEYQSDRAYYRIDGGAESSLGFAQALAQQMGIRFENYDSNAAMPVRDVRVRGAVRPAPTATLGAMEPY